MQIGRALAGIPARLDIARDKLQMVAGELNREWRRGSRHSATIMHFCGNKKPCRVDECVVWPVGLHRKLIVDGGGSPRGKVLGTRASFRTRPHYFRAMKPLSIEPGGVPR